jgi:hypothetical protein
MTDQDAAGSAARLREAAHAVVEHWDGVHPYLACSTNDHIDTLRAALAAPAPAAGLRVGRLARAIENVNPTGPKYPDRLAAEYARLEAE